jgi:hypothetical protein
MLPTPDDHHPIEPAIVARRLGKYDEGTRSSNAALAHQIKLASANEAEARMLQNQVGDDVVILYQGRAYVPYSGDRFGYDMMTSYDLDAAIMGIKLDLDLDLDRPAPQPPETSVDEC